MQRELRDQVQPLLDERERLLVENGELKADLEKLTAPKAKKSEAA
jgi:regulator of replication initiation timing